MPCSPRQGGSKSCRIQRGGGSPRTSPPVHAGQCASVRVCVQQLRGLRGTSSIDLYAHGYVSKL
eukprot:5671999-Prymnesium_polylepis.1